MIAFFREDLTAYKRALPPHSREHAGVDGLLKIATAKELEFDRELCRALEQSLAEDPAYQAQIGGVQ